MNNELQKPKIRKETKDKKGNTLISLSQVVEDFKSGRNNETINADFEIIDNRNCVFNVNKIEDRLKELGALEDIDHEVINPKLLTESKK